MVLKPSVKRGVIYNALVSILCRVAGIAVLTSAFVLVSDPIECFTHKRKQTFGYFLIACHIGDKQFVLALASALRLTPTAWQRKFHAELPVYLAVKCRKSHSRFRDAVLFNEGKLERVRVEWCVERLELVHIASVNTVWKVFDLSAFTRKECLARVLRPTGVGADEVDEFVYVLRFDILTVAIFS